MQPLAAADFDVGARRNRESVFGKDPRYWFLPVWGKGPDGDGVHWPIRQSGGESGDSVQLLENGSCGSDSDSV